MRKRVHGRDKRGDGGVFQSYGYWNGREEGEGRNPCVPILPCNRSLMKSKLAITKGALDRAKLIDGIG